MLSSISTFTLLISTLITSSTASSISLNPSRRQDVNLLDINTYLANSAANGTAPPGQRPQDSPGQFISVTPANGTDSFSQLSYCPTIFVTGAAVNGSFTPGGGWEGLPQVTYFDLKRDVKVGDATMPYYEEYGKDNTKIKRVIMIMPGQPRDSWKYAQLVRNSLLCAAANDRTIDLATILIVAPQFLALEDKAKGSGVDTDLAWEGSSWSGISDSRSPDGTRYSMMEALDGMVEHYFDTANYPALNSVYLAGHSLGATTVQRYNVLRKPTPNDPNVYSWIGNPGAYVWPVSSRPNMTGVDSGCLDYDSWAYGLNLTGPLPSYRKDDLLANKTNVLDQYFNRTVVHSLGLLDDGSGTNQCAAFFQGASHLERGQNFFKALQTLPNGQPSSFSVDFVNTSHIDYQMLADPSTQNYFFKQNIDVKNPQLVISNTSSNESSTNGTGSSNGSGSTSDNNASGSGSNGQSGDSSDAMKILSSRNLIFGTALISFGSFLLI